MDTLKINNNISYYRKKSGMTQEELASKLGVTNQSVSKWESAQCCPDIALIPNIAQIFGISIGELFGCEDPAQPHGNPHAVAHCSAFPWKDDDTVRIVVARGHTILAETPAKELKVVLDGRINNVESAVNIECSGDIQGDASAGGDISCGDIEGDVSAGRDVSCGNVEGDVSAGMNVSCGDIEGDVSAGMNVSCGDIDGDTIAGGGIGCSGAVNGNIFCRGGFTGDDKDSGERERYPDVTINGFSLKDLFKKKKKD